VRERLKDWSYALDLDELPDEPPTTAVEEIVDSFAPGFQPRRLGLCRLVLTRRRDAHLPSATTLPRGAI
jgi:hypothetical protein